MKRDKLKQLWHDNKFNIGMVVGGMAAMAGFAIGTKIARERNDVVSNMPFNRLPSSRTVFVVPQDVFERKAPYTQYLTEAN